MTNAVRNIVRRAPGEESVFQLFETEAVQVVPIDDTRRQYMQAKIDMAKSLGLSAQVELLQRELRRESTPPLSIPAMTVEEIAIWRAFLPRTHRMASYSQSTASYNYDVIPMPVMEKWKECVDAKMFSVYEIWRPMTAQEAADERERERPARMRVQDPALIGYADGVPHLIARWAESDANFVTVGDVKRKLVGRWLNNEMKGTFIFLGLMAIMMTVLFAGFFGAAVGSFLMALKTASMVTVPALLVVSAWITAVRMLSSSVMRAIWRHTLGRHHG